MGEEAIAECIRDIDANGDGEIDFQEFMAIMAAFDRFDLSVD